MEAPGPDDPGYDDWFDEPEPPTETQSGANRGVYEDAEEVWVLPEEEDSGSSGQREFVIAGRTLTTTQVAIIALSLLAIFFAILAASGVFNGNKTAVPPVTPPTHPIHTVTVTTTPNTTPTVEAPSQTPQARRHRSAGEGAPEGTCVARLLARHARRRLRPVDHERGRAVPDREEASARTALSGRQRSPRCRRR